MPTLITADLHLNANPRDSYRHQWCDKLPALLRERKIDRLLILGDLTGEKDCHTAWLTNRLVSIVRSLAEVCPVYLLQGNHDYRNPSMPFFGFLQHYRQVYWIGEIAELSLVGLGHCLFIPHQAKSGVWSSMPVLRKKWDWVFAHTTFSGARNEQDRELEGVPIDVVSGHRVVSGDVHVPQICGPVTYVGAPYTVNFGDQYHPRLLIVSESWKMQSLPSAGPRKLLIEINDMKQLERQETGIDDIVKIRCGVDSRSFDQWPNIQRRIMAWADERGIVLDSIHPIPLVADAKESPITPVIESASDTDLMRAYCARHRVGDDILKLGLRLMERT